MNFAFVKTSFSRNEICILKFPQGYFVFSIFCLRAESNTLEVSRYFLLQHFPASFNEPLRGGFGTSPAKPQISGAQVLVEHWNKILTALVTHVLSHNKVSNIPISGLISFVVKWLSDHYFKPELIGFSPTEDNFCSISKYPTRQGRCYAFC